MVGHGAEAQATACALLQCGGDRVVFEHQDVVEQGFTALPGPALDIEQRRVLLLAQGNVLALQLRQPIGQSLFRLWAGHHRQGVDEQAYLLFNPNQFSRAPRHCRAEGNRVVAGVALQQQQPRALHQGVEGDFLLTGELAQALGKTAIQHTHMLGVPAGKRLATLADAMGQARRFTQLGQLLLPERFTDSPILALQPGDVVVIAPGKRRHRRTAVALQHLTEQLRIAPAVQQDVVIGVDQVITIGRRTYHGQAQQCGLLQIERLNALLLGEVIQRRCKRAVLLPVMKTQRHHHVLVHHLHRPLERALPEEATAQDVMFINRRLPGRAETLDLQTVDIDTQLVDIRAAFLLVQAVEQHTVLHRRQRVDIGNRAGRPWQAVQLCLGEVRQREIRRCDRAVGVITTMGDQCTQFAHIVVRQGLNGLRCKHPVAEGPAQAQLAAIHLAVERQPVGQLGVQALLGTGRLARRHEQGLVIELVIELPQVIERDARHRQATQRGLARFVTEVAQRTKTEAFVRDSAQLLLDRLDRRAEVVRHLQAHREQAGEPTHGAGQVQVVEHLFTAMPFEGDARGVITRPASDHACQGRQ
ncbi:hypothetical protein [Pseudomonas sp. 22 E 5]|nr:hypothetical protein [Pseudomonas sp. 22 E 5]